MKTLLTLYYVLNVLIHDCTTYSPDLKQHRQEVIEAVHQLDIDVTLGMTLDGLSADRLHIVLLYYKDRIATCSKSELCSVCDDLKELLSIIICKHEGITR